MTENAILVHMCRTHVDPVNPCDEFQELALAVGVKPVALVRGTCINPHPRYFVGTGKAAEILEVCQSKQVGLVLFNQDLSASQERNLEQLLRCRVIGRTGLILDIFAQRARSFEGKLQVELAQLQHLATRLVGGWTHLERQRGGSIGLRGPGETQLETDRRLIRKRIKVLKERLGKVKKQREQNRQARRRSHLPIVAIVGYTNAGKSTLFNRLTKAAVHVADQVFATLDPTLRRVRLPNGQGIILVDTVGFIRQLPLALVDAFRATLEETQTADFLLHLIDVSSADFLDSIKEVEAVLQQIGAAKVRRLFVYNKIDLLPDTLPHLQRDMCGAPQKAWLSAETGWGIDLLQQALMELNLARPSISV